MQTKAALQYLALALGQGRDPRLQQHIHLMGLRHVLGVQRQHIDQAVAQRQVPLFVVQRGVQRARSLGHRQQVLHIAGIAPQQRRNVVHPNAFRALRDQCRVILQRTTGTQNMLQLTHHIHGQAHRAALVHQRAIDRLAYPPGGIGGKPETPFRLELVDGMHQPQVALFNQIGHGHATPAVAFGNADHQPKVVLDHALTGAKLPGACARGGVELFFGGKQLRATYAAQIDGQRIGRLARRFRYCFYSCLRNAYGR